jgi:hypothetical protein
MTIRSNPPGAMVYIDNREIGTTPVSTNFTYYGTREFRLVKDGYETLSQMRTIPAPSYEFVPLDFVSENLVPGEIRDRRTLDFQLVPQRVVPTEEILGRAEGLRRDTRAFGVVQAGPPPGTSGTGVSPVWGQHGQDARATPQVPPFGPGSPSPWTPGVVPGAAPASPPGAPPSFAPGAPPSFAPGVQQTLPPGPSANDLLPYPTEPPGGWQGRG